MGKTIRIVLVFALIFAGLPAGFAKEPSEEEILLLSAQKEQKSLKWQESLLKFRQIISAFPKTQAAQKSHIETGKFYKYHREWQKAIREYRGAVDISPHSRPAHDAKTAEAAIYYFRQDFPAALEIFKEVLSETKDWDQIKYCSYWIKALKRKMAFSEEENFSCGPEALNITFNLLGIKSDRKETAKLFKKEKSRVSLLGLTKVASQKGLRPKVVKVASGEIQNLNTPFIALVNPDHYVVVTDTKDARDIKYIDPANRSAEQSSRLGEFSRSFKGYALIFLEDTKLAKAVFESPADSELAEIKGGVCWCCPPSNLGGRSNNPNVEYDGKAPCSPGMPSWMVNTVNLNFIVQDIDFSYSARGMPVEFIRTYNADDPREGIFGRSWAFNYNISLLENPDTSIDITRGDGRVDHFFWNGTRYQGPDGIYDSLTKNADATYTLKVKNDKLTQSFNSAGKLLSIKDSNNNSITFTYDGEGKLAQISDPNSRNISLTYGANNKASRITLSDGRHADFTYDANNNLIQSVDMKGAASSFTYDGASYITAIRTPHEGTTAITYTVGSEGYYIKTITDGLGNTRTYDTYQTHKQVRIRDSLGNAALFKNNSDSLTESITLPSGSRVSFEYDAFGNRTKIKDALDNATVLAYDSKGNVASVTDPLGNKATFSYDADDNITQAAGPKGGISSFTYDANANLTQLRDADDKTTSFSYNPYGQLARLTDANGSSSDFAYDAQGNLISATDPLGKITNYGYDALGRTISLTGPKGSTFGYAYDGVDHLTKITNPDSSEINYTYNCCNLTQVQDSRGALNFTYDALGRLTGFSGYDGKAVSYAYDSEGNLLTLTYPDNKQAHYEYDGDGRMIKVTDWLGNVTRYGYDSRGNLASSVSPGLLTVYKYDAASRPASLVNYNSGNFSVISGFEFTYDAVGSRTKIKKFLPLNLPEFNTGAVNYSYNNGNQVIQATGQSFSYDDNGNLTARAKQGASSSSLTYNYNNQLVNYASGAANLSYLYDALDNRIQKTSSGIITKYIVDPSSTTLAQADASGNISAYYVYGLGLISKIEGNSAYFYQYDGTGSTVAVTDASGAVVNKYGYDDFGNLALNSAEAIANPFKYAGKFGVITDAPDLLYMRARFYMPSIGRFINKDPAGLSAGLNSYTYTGNNPVNFVDAEGLMPQWLAGALIGGMIDLGLQIGGNILSGDPCRKWYNINWYSVARSAALGALFSAGVGPRGWLLGRGRGILNSNDYVRVGWSWKGTAKAGKEIIRIAVGSKRLPFHWHFP